MKKLFIPFLACLCACSSANAQKFYFRGGLGYAISHGGVGQSTVSGNTGNVFPLQGNYSSTQIPGTTAESFKLQRVSFTSGLHGILGFGLMFNKSIGVDLAASVGLATRTNKASVYTERAGIRESLNVTQQANMPVFLTPSLVIQTDGKIKAYARGGVVFPVKADMTQEIRYIEELFNQQTNAWERTTYDWTEDFSMRLNPGVSGSIGMKLSLAKNITVWTELYLLAMTLYFKQSELTSYAENGESILGQIAPSNRITNYEFKANNSGNTNTTPTYQVPYGNFGFHVGVMVDLK